MLKFSSSDHQKHSQQMLSEQKMFPVVSLNAPCLGFDHWPVLEVLGTGLDIFCLQHETSVVQDGFTDLQKTEKQSADSGCSQQGAVHTLTSMLVCELLCLSSCCHGDAAVNQTLTSTQMSINNNYWLLRFTQTFYLHSTNTAVNSSTGSMIVTVLWCYWIIDLLMCWSQVWKVTM